MTDAIFQTTGQALATSFLIVASPVRQDGILRAALMRMIEALENPTPAQLQHLADLRGARSDSIDFGGLTSDEIRAQCAMVVQSVTDHLPAPERAAVIGAYTRRPMEKVEVTRYLSEYLKPGFDVVSGQRFMLDYCVLRCLPTNDDTKARKLAPEIFGVTPRTLAGYVRELRKRINQLRSMGESRLEPIFIRHGVVHAR